MREANKNPTDFLKKDIITSAVILHKVVESIDATTTMICFILAKDTRDKTCLNSLSNTNISLYRMEEEWLSGLRLHQASGQNYQRNFLILNWRYLQPGVKVVSNTTSRSAHENHFSPRSQSAFFEFVT